MSEHAIQLPRRTALVTGVSRKTGMGAGIVRELARAGINIFTTYFRPYDLAMPWQTDPDDAELILRQVRAYGVEAAGMEADLADNDTPQRIMDAAVHRFGHIDILVNNATHDVPADILSITADSLDQHHAVNVRGLLLLVQAFVKQHDGRPGGRIISLTSGQALEPMPDSLPYVAGKGAVEAITLSLSASLASKGITVNSVDPGATDTGWMDDELREELASLSPFGRVGLPEDAARLVRFLASEDARWITGQVLRSRGGL